MVYYRTETKKYMIFQQTFMDDEKIGNLELAQNHQNVNN